MTLNSTSAKIQIYVSFGREEVQVTLNSTSAKIQILIGLIG